MFNNYFVNMEKKILKRVKTTKTKESKSKEGAKSKEKALTNYDELKKTIYNMIPSNLILDSIRFIDPSGYSPEGVDFIVYKEFCRDIVNIMGGFIPSELVYGTYYISTNLNKKGLNDILRRVVQAKKINRYTEKEKQSLLIPAFVIAYDTDYTFPDLKNSILDFYTSMSIDHDFEVDIIAILSKGIVIKNWRDKRNFIALETENDTLMWFFVLMNEYLNVEREDDLDLRDYVRHNEKYNEY